MKIYGMRHDMDRQSDILNLKVLGENRLEVMAVYDDGEGGGRHIAAVCLSEIGAAVLRDWLIEHVVDKPAVILPDRTEIVK